MANKAGNLKFQKYTPTRDAAYTDWKQGMKLHDIAEKHEIHVQTVKTWVNKYFKPRLAFETVEPPEVPGEEFDPALKITSKHLEDTALTASVVDANVPQEDNPRKQEKSKGLKRNRHIGKYGKLLKEDLTDSEAVLFNRMKVDPIKQLDETIRLLSIRELRVMNQLAKLDEDKNMVTEYEDVIIPARNGDKTGILDRRVRRTRLVIDKVLQLEEVLSTIQDKKVKALSTLQKLKREAEDAKESGAKVVILNNIPREGV